MSISLTRFAISAVASQTPTVADILAPRVATGTAEFTIPDFGSRGFMQVPDARRAIHGYSKSIITDDGEIEVSLKPYALHVDIDNHQLDKQQDEGSKMALRKSKIGQLMAQTRNSHLNNVITYLRSQYNGDAKTWTGDTTPIADINTAIATIADAVGEYPTDIIFSRGAFSLFAENKNVRARLDGHTGQSIDPAGVGAMLENRSIRSHVSTHLFDTPLASTSTKTNALASDVWIIFRDESPTEGDASFAKTFSINQNPVDTVRRSEEKKDFGERWITDWTQEVMVTNASAAVRLTVS